MLLTSIQKKHVLGNTLPNLEFFTRLESVYEQWKYAQYIAILQIDVNRGTGSD